jgi:hypothetical protein
LNRHKLRFALGLVGNGSEHLFTPAIATKELQANYLEFIQLDGKPEKGERKIADDCVLMIYDIWEQENNAVMFHPASEDSQGVCSH